MNEIIAPLILALVQGITEWLPVSSSGHLVIFERFLGYNPSLSFEIALHFGTLMAVFVYFGKDITDMIKDFFRGNWETESGRMAWLLVLATIPAALIGYIFYDFFERTFDSLQVVALGFSITGVLLLIASLNLHSSIARLNWRSSLLIGLAQAVSILPGVSRSGTTTASGLMLGLSEKAALRFSFLLSIPIIFGANMYSLSNEPLPRELILATLVSFASGLIVIHLLFTKLLRKKRNLRWFGAYALALALGLGLWLLLY